MKLRSYKRLLIGSVPLLCILCSVAYAQEMGVVCIVKSDEAWPTGMPQCTISEKPIRSTSVGRFPECFRYHPGIPDPYPSVDVSFESTKTITEVTGGLDWNVVIKAIKCCEVGIGHKGKEKSKGESETVSATMTIYLSHPAISDVWVDYYRRRCQQSWVEVKVHECWMSFEPYHTTEVEKKSGSVKWQCETPQPRIDVKPCCQTRNNR